ncbi:MAG: hypothetical protein WC510_02945 [Candidatus Omnitrophota bacterium]
MRLAIKLVLAAAAFMSTLLLLPSFAISYSIPSAGSGLSLPPEPRLIHPVSEEAVLTGKGSLEFKWSIVNLVEADHCEFRLYKGYNMYASNLIFKQALPAKIPFIEINSGIFEDGQVYTWSVREVSFWGRKSERAFCSFRVVKKG